MLAIEEFRNKGFKGAFAKVRKANLSVVLSARLCVRLVIVRTEQLWFKFTAFVGILYLGLLLKFVTKIQVLLQI
jgi:hypothetical protein